MGGRGRGRASGGVRIVVAAPAARFDAPPGVTVTGAPPGPGPVYGVIAGSPISVVNVGYPDAGQPAWTYGDGRFRTPIRPNTPTRSRLTPRP